MKQSRKFKGVWIPVGIWTNHELTITDRCLLAEIDSLDNDNDRRCWASNKYFAIFFGVSEATIKRSISKLKKLNLISYKYSKTREGLERNIWLIGIAQYDLTPEVTQGQIDTEPKVKMTLNPRSKRPTNNIDINNIEDNRDIGEKSKRFVPPPFIELMDYFFEKLQSKEIAKLEAEKFQDFYLTKGWMVGKNKMKDWKAAVRNWLRRKNENNNGSKQEQQASIDEAKEYLFSKGY